MAAVPTRPAAALLDVNETLSDLGELRERFDGVGADPWLLDTWFASTLRDGIALTASGDYADFVDVAWAALRALLGGAPGLRFTVKEAAEEILSGFASLPVHADVPPGLTRLRDAGMRVATLTNGSAAIAKGLLERAGLTELVERNLDVSAVRRWKPHPEPYLHACRTLGISPEEAVLIAAHPWDVHGAKRAGLRGAWLNRRGADYPAIFETPDAEGADLPSLAAALVAYGSS